MKTRSMRPLAHVTRNAFALFILAMMILNVGAQYPSTPLISWRPDGLMLALTSVSGVRILDGNTLEMLNEIPGTAPGMVPEFRVKAEWSPDGTRMAIFNNKNIEIWSSPWSPTAATLVATVLIDNWPSSITWNPIGTKIAMTVNESVILADAQTGLVLQEFNGSWSSVLQVLWTSDDRLVLTGLGSFTAIFDEHTGAIITSFYTINYGLTTNHSIAFSPDNSRIAIGDSAGFIEIRNDTRTPGEYVEAVIGIDQRFRIPPQGETDGEYPEEITSFVLDLDWSFDGRYLASSSDDGTVRIWNPDTGENLTTITVAPGAWVGSAAWRPNSLELAIGNLDGSVSIAIPQNVVPSATLTPTPTETSTPTSTPTATITHTPTNTATFTATNTHTPSATSTPSMVPTPMPVGGWLVFVSERPVVTGGSPVSNLYVGDDNGYTIPLTNNTNTNVSFAEPQWSPNFSEIAYSKKTGSDENLCILTVSTLLETCDFIINDTPNVPVRHPVWSPDSQKMAYVSTTSGAQDIFTIGITDLRNETGTPVNVTPGVNGDSIEPDWRDDSQWIVFSSNRVTTGNPEGNNELYIVKTNGTGTKQMTVTGAQVDNRRPAWSPNGDRIAYNSDAAVDAKHDVVHRRLIPTTDGTSLMWDPNSSLVNLTANLPNSFRFTTWKEDSSGVRWIAVVRGEGNARQIMRINVPAKNVELGPWNTSYAENDPNW